MQERRTQQNKDRSRHQSPENAPEEDAVLERPRHPKVGEDDEEDKDVIDGEGFLDQVTGKELKACPGSEPQVDPEVEEEGHADPDPSPDERFAHANLVRPAMEDAEVQDQHRHNERGESDPQNRSADAFEIHKLPHALAGRAFSMY